MIISIGMSAVAVAFALLVVVTLAAGIRTIPQGFVHTVERLGRYNRSLQAGLGPIIPMSSASAGG